ncbi:MAG: 50S ribosomal protein L25 [Parcubacteria group bacterium GW2011_GWB1_52_7]|nr:MAG: 50S ribosomal protein L25 [Parcubacteria group bacterium GW2011_GWA1_51_12]KKW28049.1 MAG: 50S ribosomal protein L25 [Parcubacteria group bacterium GW2011_GWB1_52_7]
MPIELQAEKREVLGKRSKTIRKGGLLPAVLYGAETASVALAVPLKSFQKVLEAAGESSLVNLLVGGKQHNVLIHDVAVDPLTGLPIHADFLSVRMDKEIRAKVPFEFVGEASAVKAEGGILVRVMHEVEISALPKDLPHTIQIDLHKLEHVNDRITIGDLTAPSGVKIIAEQDDVITLVEAPRSEEELKALEGVEPAAPVQVETEREADLKVEAEKEAAEKAAEE